MDRRELGSWLTGPVTALGPEVGDQDYRGQHLGLPGDGPGSVAGFGRRTGALFIDWFVALGLVTLLSSGRLGLGAPPGNASASGWSTLLVFLLLITLLTWLAQATIGQRVLGIGVVVMSGGRIGPLRSLLRSALICLVVPAVVYDRDGRGLHDKVANTIVLSMR